MKIELRYFASIREALGPGESFEVAADMLTLGALRELLIARGGRHAEVLAHGRAVRAAIDQQMVVNEAAPIVDGAELAFFPPVTGG
ncbi:MAG: hypothetical protein RLZZ598_842 [Pseudomonadota bacterium]|jgi:molybdopterin synthase sulfur carrier subunit